MKIKLFPCNDKEDLESFEKELIKIGVIIMDHRINYKFKTVTFFFNLPLGQTEEEFNVFLSGSERLLRNLI
jgi:hypothetical protein